MRRSTNVRCFNAHTILMLLQVCVSNVHSTSIARSTLCSNLERQWDLSTKDISNTLPTRSFCANHHISSNQPQPTLDRCAQARLPLSPNASLLSRRRTQSACKRVRSRIPSVKIIQLVVFVLTHKSLYPAEISGPERLPQNKLSRCRVQI